MHNIYIYIYACDVYDPPCGNHFLIAVGILYSLSITGKINAHDIKNLLEFGQCARFFDVCT